MLTNEETKHGHTSFLCDMQRLSASKAAIQSVLDNSSNPPASVCIVFAALLN